MFKYILLPLIILLYATSLLIDSSLENEMLHYTYIICINLMSTLLAITILNVEKLGKIYKRVLCSIIIVVSLWFVINYISVIMTTFKDEVHYRSV